MVHLFEIGSGKSLSDGPPLSHSVGIMEIALSQAGLASDRQIALVDKNRDVYLAMVRNVSSRSSRKIMKLGWLPFVYMFYV